MKKKSHKPARMGGVFFGALVVLFFAGLIFLPAANPRVVYLTPRPEADAILRERRAVLTPTPRVADPSELYGWAWIRLIPITPEPPDCVKRRCLHLPLVGR